MSGSVIVAGARTPIGRLLGGLKALSAADLGGVAIKGALEKAGVSGDQVDYLIMGQVIQAGAGQNPARTRGHRGRPADVACPSITINKVCLSGLNAIALADQLIRAGEAEIVVAGGMESMTNAPHLLPKSREGFKYGDTTLVDSMAYDALYDQATQQAMGALTEEYNAAHTSADPRGAGRVRRRARTRRPPRRGRTASSTTRSSRSRSRSARATRSWSVADEGVRGDTTAESLSASCARRSARTARSPPARPRRSPTAPCAVVVMSKAKAEELGLEWLAEIGAHGMVAGPDSTLQLQPANATKLACDKEGIAPADLDLVEFNEAFAAVGIDSTRALGLDDVEGQRQRRRDRARPPGRHVRRPDRAAPRPRAEAPRRRRRRGRPVRRRRPGRRPDRARVLREPTLRRATSATWSRRAREGDPRAVARLISLVEDDSPLLREVMAALAPYAGHAQIVGHHRLAGRRQVDVHVRAGRPSCARPASGSACSRSTRRRRSPAARCSATGCGCRTTRLDRDVYIRSMASRGHLGGLAWTHAAGAAGARRRRLRRDPGRDRRRRAERGRDRRPGRHHAGAAGARAWATASRPPRPGSSRSATSTSSTRPTATAPTRCAATCARCSRWPTGPRAPGGRRS